MATIVTRLANTGTLLLNGSYDELSLAAGSISFNGTNQTLTIPTNAGFSVGTGDFTIEAWVYVNSGAIIGDIWSASATSGSIAFYMRDPVQGMRLWISGADVAFNFTQIAVNVWHHIAVVRSAGSIVIYVDGVGGTAASYATGITGVTTTYVGSYLGNGEWWNGNICNLRFSNTAIYTANFTPPQSMLPAITGTQLLLNVTDSTNFIKDNSSNSLTITNTNTATFSTANPFNRNNSAVKTNIDTVFSKGFDEVTGMIAAANLVAYFDASKAESYPFTGTAWVDISGNTNNGTIVNAPTYTSTTPGTFSFNGTSQYVNFPRPVQDDFTLACWFQTTSAFGTAGAWWQGMGLIDGEMPGGQNDFGLSMGAGKTMLGIGNPDQTLLSSSTYNDGVWHYVAGTRNKTSGAVKMYVDGALVNSATFVSTNTLSSPANLTIGALQTLASYYSGNIASVQLYSRELTLAEVQNNFNVDAVRFSRTPLAKPGVKREANTGILTAATFDEITGAPVIDSSLLLWLDAGQTTSYSGSGSTWTDLSTYQNNATLSSTPFSTAYGGSLNFVPAQGSLGALTSSKLNTTYAGKTILIAARMDAAFGLSSGFHGMFGTADGVALRNFNTYMFSDATGYKIHFSWGNGTVNDGNTSEYLPVIPGQWFVIAVSQSATGHTYYYNGTAYGTRAGAFTQYNTTTNETVGKADNIFIGDIATVMLYTRALTADEINQNFNALRRRFGI